MDIQKVKELVSLMEGNSINVIEVTEGEAKIRIEKNTAPIMPPMPMPERPVETKIQLTANEVIKADSKKNFKSEVKSPMVGVYYAAPAPGAEPFVKVGSKVKKGDVLCIVEAMKLMNEIYAETDGTISEICLADGDVAEFNQVLFRLN